jgi:hypothetical protein
LLLNTGDCSMRVCGSVVLQVAFGAARSRVETRNCLTGQPLRFQADTFECAGRTLKCITFGWACNLKNSIIFNKLAQEPPTYWLPSTRDDGYYPTLS